MSLRRPLGATNKEKSCEKCVIERSRRRGRGERGGENVVNVLVFIIFSRMQVFTFSVQVAKHDGGRGRRGGRRGGRGRKEEGTAGHTWRLVRAWGGESKKASLRKVSEISKKHWKNVLSGA